MAEVAQGDVVTIHFKGWLDDGTVFVSSEDGDPLEFVAGGGDVFKALSAGVLGMRVGDRKQLAVPPEQGYGHRDPNLERAVLRERVPEGVEVGDKLTASAGSAEIPVWVRQLTETHAVIDANHPLAGQTLNLEIEVVSQATDASRPNN